MQSYKQRELDILFERRDRWLKEKQTAENKLKEIDKELKRLGYLIL
ncbi:hypothetical protein [Streptococcus uberis]|nr:hypothetical protein [Streptococcus uberis]